MRLVRASSTRWAILGLLGIRPMSGYDIRKAAATSIGHFWSESYGQIYPALKELEAEGLARRHAARRGARSDRQAYAITEEGRSALREWLAKEPESRPVRSELLLKLFFGGEGAIADQIAHVRRLREQEEAHVAEYRALRAELDGAAPHRSRPYWAMTLSFGEHRSEAMLRWCDETLAALERLRRVRPTTTARRRSG